MKLHAPLIHDVQTARREFLRMSTTGRLRNAFRKPDELSIFTAHNYAEPSLLERNLDFLGIHGCCVLRRAVPVWSNSLRVRWFVEYLTRECPTSLVLYCDADDVILRDDPRKIMAIFEECDCDALFGSTRWPHGYKCIPDIRSWADRVHPRRYLNGGVVIGRRDFLLELYRDVLEYVTDDDTQGNLDSHAFYRQEEAYTAEFPRSVGCDQAILRFLEPKYHPRLKVDADNRLVWRNDNRTPWERVVRTVKRNLPVGLKRPLKRWLPRQ